MSLETKIAIVAMGGQFPGARDLEHFWNNVASGVDSSREVPRGRWLLDPQDVVLSGGPYADRTPTARGYFLDEIPNAPEFAGLDPVYHLVLHVGRQCFSEANTRGLDRTRAGIILGHIALPTEKASQLAIDYLGRTFAEKLGVPDPSRQTDPMNRYVAGLPAGILAKSLGFGGNVYCLDAACASSLYAVKLACDELRAGRADFMLAGGASRPDCLYTQMGFAQLRALSPRGRCSPFDAAGDGLLVGEGCGIVALKRLADALRDGDGILAVVAGAGVSNDIEGNLLAPASEGQLRAMQLAYEQAGWNPSDVDLIECHATGTPVGDAVEFASLRSLWRDADYRIGQCVIGSVKSNVGHLLTGAGAAGLIKVLHALQHRSLPPTANFRTPNKQMDLANSPFRVLTQRENWPNRDDGAPRRAAISGFGFGGINAHILLEEFQSSFPRTSASALGQPPFEPIAIVGMDSQQLTHVDSGSLECQFRDDANTPVNHTNWFGVESSQWFRREFEGVSLPKTRAANIDVPLNRFRIPPKELEEMLPQQLLMMLAADAALRDSGTWENCRRRTGVFLGLGLDLSTTNYHFRWWVLQAARQWRLQQQGEIDPVEFEQWVNQLRDSAHPALNANRTMGALASIAASRIARAFQFGGPSFTISSEESSAGHALETAIRSLQRREIDLALVGAADFPTDIRSLISARELGQPVDTFHDGAAAVVLKRLANAENDGDRIYAIIRGIGVTHGENGREMAKKIAHGDNVVDAMKPLDISNSSDSTGAATGLLSIVRAGRSLFHHIQEDERGASYWLSNRDDGPRLAEIATTSADGNSVHVVLEEAPNSPAMILNQVETLKLYKVEADSPSEICQELDRLEESPHFQTDSNKSDAKLGLALVARNELELKQLIADARKHLSERPELPFRNNDQIAYEPRPLGPTGQLALVFPGSGNHFHGMGRDIAVRWPETLRKQESENRRLKDQFAPEVFWNASASDSAEPTQALFGQVAIGCLVSDVLQHLGVRPAASIGYSLGETAGLFALRAWTDRDEMLKRMNSTELFRRDLSGECRAARLAWDIPNDVPFEWFIGVMPCSADRVRPLLGPGSRTYLLIINTPDECVVGGERRAVDRLASELGVAKTPLHGVTIAHCELVKRVGDEYRNLHLLPTTPPAGIRFYSGALGRSYEVTREAAADAILGHASDTIDFPRLIRRAFDDGVRFFVEVGPGASCTRMIGRILGDRPHFARSVCVDDCSSEFRILSLMAQLHAHRVPLFERPPENRVTDSTRISGPTLQVPIGGKPFELPPFPLVRSISKPTPVAEVGKSQLPVASNPMLTGFVASNSAAVEAHAAYLRVQEKSNVVLSSIMSFSNELLARAMNSREDEPIVVEAQPVLNTALCQEFAVGSIARVLGPEYAEIDSHPTRVRLPDGPLMLVDNIWLIEGEPRSLGSGRVVTDHHVHADRWYINEGHIPTAICVEAGQADLFLSGYLGIDLVTKGLAVYRLLDAVVTFHRELPKPGETIRYDIHIDRFFRQGETHLFRFRFEGKVNGAPLLTMRDGCAGFFTAEELAAGKGIVHTALDRRPIQGKRPADWSTLAPLAGIESFDSSLLGALRDGDIGACFGEQFERLQLHRPLTLPGGKLKLVDRVVEFDPSGGRFGLGRIRAEMDIHPSDWFLTCHFVDDMVMPGTLMYECCLHTLRIFLLRMGWIGECGRNSYEPVPGIDSQLKCRGQVTASTKTVTYEVSIKELGYRPEPFAIADALMYADGKPIVEINNMSLRMTGASREEMEALWAGTTHKPAPLFDRDRILAFAVGKPSDAFGDRYRVFDNERVIARLPGPPFQFLDRIIDIQNCRPWELAAGGEIIAEYDVPPDEWYFAANRAPNMPFAVLLEIALQPCGWLAAYLGSALTSEEDLSFRNLGGTAKQLMVVGPDIGVLSTWVKITNVSRSGGMIIQNYDFKVSAGGKPVYEGNTVFGFFSKAALSQQVGVRDAKLFQPEPRMDAESGPMPSDPPHADRTLRMMDRIELFIPDGGSRRLGFIRGAKTVDPDEWFFKAHFHQDPVWPGSLGLEAFLQLLKVVADRRWGRPGPSGYSLAIGSAHTWIYRGQVLPTNRRVTVDANVTAIDEDKRTITADGFLAVDERVIYQMNDFTLQG